MYKQLILAMLPELFLLTIACLVLLWDAFTKKALAWVGYSMVIVGILGAAGLCCMHNNFSSMGIISDNSTAAIKMVICLLAAVAFVYSKASMQLRGLFRGEYFVLYLFSLLGALLLVSSNNFLVLYLGIELLSVPLYAIIAIDKNRGVALEAALKFFIMGALASGIFLYGVSLLYGVNSDISFVTHLTAGVNTVVFKFSMVFIVVGLFFKLGLIPFHMWLPDVYEGSPTAIAAFIATVPKIAVFVVLYRVLMGPYASLFVDWQHIIIVLAVLSIGIGNIVAIVQDNIKRMLGYSTIANIGFAILAFVVNNFSAAMYYVIAYAIMYLGVFGTILVLSRDGIEFDNIEDFRGLGIRQPWLAVIMLIFMFSMIGIPPMIGFWAKFLVLNALISKGFIGLAVLALLLSVVGIFYCLRLVKVMFFAEEVVFAGDVIPRYGVMLLVLNAAIVLLFGVCTGVVV